jgi:hypothetical protein
VQGFIGVRQYYSEMECKENYRRVVKRRCTVRYQSNSIKGAEKLISPKILKMAYTIDVV